MCISNVVLRKMIQYKMEGFHFKQNSFIVIHLNTGVDFQFPCGAYKQTENM